MKKSEFDNLLIKILEDNHPGIYPEHISITNAQQAAIEELFLKGECHTETADLLRTGVKIRNNDLAWEPE